MNYYVDIEVLPDPEFHATTLMNTLYAKLHRALVSVGAGEVGVSFPQANKTPGSLLRLHGRASTLEYLMHKDWLKGLRDYTRAGTILPAPITGRQLRVRRIQYKKTAARLRRAVKRGSLSESEAQTALDHRRLLKQPFFQLQSQSTGQRFPLFITQEEVVSDAVPGKFNSYGLSDCATVPFF